MNISEKIILLRKANGMSQETLAEKLDISRQAVSRWENGSALPDAMNILQLSKLFGVTTDYLLNDDYESDSDLPPVKETAEYFELKIKKDKRLLLFAGFCWIIAAFCFLFAAIDTMNIIYIPLVIIDVILSGVFFFRYFNSQNKK